MLNASLCSGNWSHQIFLCDPLMETITILFPFGGQKETCLFLILLSSTLEGFLKRDCSHLGFYKRLWKLGGGNR